MNIDNLHNYQVAAYKHIINNPYCGLFLEMGLGKTISTLTAIEKLIFDYAEISRVLIVAPKRVVETVWTDELAKWDHLKDITISLVVGTKEKRIEALNKKANIFVISRDNVAWLVSLYGGFSLPFDMLVLDELSSFKSHKAIRFKAIRNVRPSFQRVVGLTGTPAPNGLINLWSQMFLIDRGLRLEKTITRYREKYFRAGKSNGHIVYKYDLLEDSEKLIHEKIGDICISMKANDYLDMPEKIDNVIKIKMPDDLKKQYADFEKHKVLELFAPEEGEENKDITVVNAAALTNKLLQFANGAVYDEEKNYHEVHNLKIEALKDLIEEANGQPVLIAWSFRSDLERLLKALKEYKPRELKGEKDIADWNAGKIQVLLTHPASAGHGLNLQYGGHIIIWYGLTWSLELFQQFNARLYRQGQKHTVVINYILLDGTCDYDVLKALEAKDKKQESLMQAIKAKITKYLKMSL